VLSGEVKIIFKEGTDVRVLRGIITKEDQDFVFLKRNDGDYRINKNVIIKIEGRNHD